MDDMPYRQRFYVACRSRDPDAARRVKPVEERGAVRFYNDPIDAHHDADRRGGRAAGFVVLAVFIGADGRPCTPRLEFAGQAARMSRRADR
jgi:hypothetical protein